MANTKTEERYDATTGEGVEQTILSSCGETMVKDKADDLRVVNITSKLKEGFGTRLLETLVTKG